MANEGYSRNVADLQSIGRTIFGEFFSTCANENRFRNFEMCLAVIGVYKIPS